MIKFAKITDAGKLYTTYRSFAEKLGYKNAYVETDFTETRTKPQKGEIVRLLATGNHLGYGNKLWIIKTWNGEEFIIGEEGISINEEWTIDSAHQPQSTEPDPLDLIVKLSLEVAELKREVSELKRSRAFESVFAKTYGKQSADKPQSRDEIIDQAKADVTHLTEFVRNRQIGSIEFIVNRDKRTVVALWRSPSGRVTAKAVAKCAPNDCYNSHIGRAVAIRRVLNEEIPREYTNTPQPTEMRRGDTVLIGGAKRTVFAVRPTHRTYGVYKGHAFGLVERGFTFISDYDYEYWDLIKHATIIDDSREETESVR